MTTPIPVGYSWAPLKCFRYASGTLASYTKPPLSSKIEVHTATGGTYYVNKHRAREMRHEGQAVYIDSDLTTMMEVRLGHYGFADAWRIKPSGGMPVWQYQP